MEKLNKTTFVTFLRAYKHSLVYSQNHVLHRVLCCLLFFICIFSWILQKQACALNVEVFSPHTNAELLQLFHKALATFDKGDFAYGYQQMEELVHHTTRIYGSEDPLTQNMVWQLRCLNRIKSLPPKQQKEFCVSFTNISEVNKEIQKYRSTLYPTPDDTITIIKRTQDILMNAIHNKMLPEWGVKISESDFVGISSNVDIPVTIPIIRESIKALGDQATCLDLRNSQLMFLTACEQEASFPPKTRHQRLLNIIKFFHEEGTLKHRFDCQEHRARAILAEDFYIEEKKEEADKAFAQLRAEVAGFQENELAGWVLFACDRHDARRAYEQGEYEKALSYIQKAEGGCHAYGHRSVSKPLAMQQVLELKAKILRKLGKDQEAEWAEGDAKRIADNLAKCREAISKITIQVPNVTKLPDGTLHFDFDNPKIIQQGEPIQEK